MQSRISGPIPPDLTLFETMRVEADGTILLWPLHLARLQRGCQAVGFPLDNPRIETALAGLPQGQVLRARLAVNAAGQVALTHAALPANPTCWRVVISGQRLQAGDPWLAIKSSARGVYDAARAGMPDGVDETLLLNQFGQVCEGSITSIFLKCGDVMLTPALSCGLLPGVLRADLLAKGKAREAVLMPEDLHNKELFVGNALRGLIPAKLI